MKKLLCLLLMVVLCVSWSVGSAATIDEMRKSLLMQLLSISGSEIDDMNTYMNYGWGAVSGKWYYGRIYLNKNSYTTGKMRLSDVSDKTELKPIANGKGNFRQLLINDGWIYWIFKPDKKGAPDEIRKATISGENMTTVATASNGKIDYIFIYGDSIYYTENVEPDDGPTTGKLYRMDMNGSGKKVILNKPVYYPYIVGDKLLYQDDRDKLRLHMCDIDGSNDSVLIDDVVYKFVTDGGKIYYMTDSVSGTYDRFGNHIKSSSSKYIIKQYDLKSGNVEILINSNTSTWGFHDGIIYYCNLDDSGRIYTYDTRDGSLDIMLQDKNAMLQVFSSNGVFCSSHNDKGKETGYYFVYYDTFNKIDLKRK